MAASEGNALGHWESNVVTTLNDQLLASAGSRWDDWLSLSKDWNNSVLREEFLDRAVEALRQEYGQSSLFVLKDPRICRIVPLWLEALNVLDVRPVAAIPVRNPVEVAESLAARDGSAPGHGLLVWLRNVLDAEFASRDLPRFVFSYEDLLSDWSTVAEKMGSATAIAWPRKSVLTDSEIDAFLTPHARHQQYDEKIALGPRTPAWVRDTYAILTKWCKQGEDREDHARLDGIRADFDASAPTFAQLITQGTVRGEGVGEAGRQRRQLEEEVARLAQELSQTEQRHEAVSHGLAAAERAVESARNECAELERVLAETAADRDSTVSQLGAELALAQNEVETLRDQLAKASQALVAHEDNLARHREQGDNALGDLKNRLSELESALLQRQEEARQAWADATVERRTNELLRGELDRMQARYDALDLRSNEMDRRLRDQAEAILAAETRIVESGWIAKEAALRETEAQDLIARQQGEMDKLALDQRDHLSRLARYESEMAQLVRLQLELEAALRDAVERAASAERVASSDVARQRGEIVQLTRMVADDAQRVSDLHSRAEWLRDLSDLQQRFPRWWAMLPAKERARRRLAKVEASGMFDAAAYLSKHPDVAQSGMDPLVHYTRHGIFEGRSW
ncbi:hypothetical protein [Sphingomonas mali]|uniref:hypothetical protein n=1 Tax=Sphingomonas mali TaxID=40682 RepID=UPI0008337EC6|nr:hypothetical protein [Sphingomonas mali]